MTMVSYANVANADDIIAHADDINIIGVGVPHVGVTLAPPPIEATTINSLFILAAAISDEGPLQRSVVIKAVTRTDGTTESGIKIPKGTLLLFAARDLAGSDDDLILLPERHLRVRAFLPGGKTALFHGVVGGRNQNGLGGFELSKTSRTLGDTIYFLPSGRKLYVTLK